MRSIILDTEKRKLVEIDTKKPEKKDEELIVRIVAVSSNNIDFNDLYHSKTNNFRNYLRPGWDAVGVVESKGTKTDRFEVGDFVWYAGTIYRPGCYSELQAVHHSLAGHLPMKMGPKSAAALPLTIISAYTIMSYMKNIINNKFRKQNNILILGGDSYIGHCLIQLIKNSIELDIFILATCNTSRNALWIQNLGLCQTVSKDVTDLKYITSSLLNEDIVIDLRNKENPLNERILFSNMRFNDIFLIEADHPGSEIKIIKMYRNNSGLESVVLKKITPLAYDFLKSSGITAGEILNYTSKLIDSSMFFSTISVDGGILSAANLNNLKEKDLISSKKFVFSAFDHH
ncbi:hypothetical protein HZU75_12575 [Chitinibacter fontanus]|uniref:Alcohol dehydrogenase-like N-terminal domain-containing protein n=1 Tax=Chitinibacter fontanus TaxID=1737446 RepID=A0A7D5VAL2_9NEIS|nr:hypothetical protein [Chitinibacter fontanus]QLI82291.1 hypothetical protein HZU75_12575 [Chitinibacter fontanus]